MIGQNSIAAATAVVGYDMCENQTWATAGQARRLNAVGLAGSAAALDTKCDVFIGNNKVGELYNSSTGAVTKDTDMFRVQGVIPGGTPLSIKVVDAPATNPINVVVDVS